MYDMLAGIKVLETSAWLFAPSSGAILADWGASVTKIEQPPAGDPYRGFFGTGEVSPQIEVSNRGKRSIALDLRTAEGKEVFFRLVAESDVFVTSLLEDSRARLGIDVDDLRAVNPNIIYVRASGQGTRGPDAAKGGFDLASCWARAGLSQFVTSPDAPRPVPLPAGIGDVVGGLSTAAAVAAALVRRERTGKPAEIDVSLLHAGMWMLAVPLMMVANREIGGVNMDRRDRYDVPNPLVNSYKTSDGRWLWMSVTQPDPHWPSFCEHVGRPELIDDPRFKDFEARAANRAECVRTLDEVFASDTLDGWRARLATFEGVWAPNQTPEEVIVDPQVIANGYLRPTDDVAPDVQMVTSPMQFDNEPLASPIPRAPQVGQHTEEILLEIGYTWDDIARLQDCKAVV